jgi:dolichyl-phosphate-mannose--protein O-mannosyl transferase
MAIWPMLFSLLLSSAASLLDYEGSPTAFPLSYYSMIKARHLESFLFLSSLEYPFSTGTHQQMTRGTKYFNYAETLWTIFPGSNITNVHQGDPIKCGDRVRFYHGTTRVWLQANRVASQLDHGYEVSGAVSDSPNNDWIIDCQADDGPTLTTQVYIKNLVIGCFLSGSETAEYPAEVAGQFEVFCDDAEDRNEWVIDKGIFVGGYVEDDEGAD